MATLEENEEMTIVDEHRDGSAKCPVEVLEHITVVEKVLRSSGNAMWSRTLV